MTANLCYLNGNSADYFTLRVGPLGKNSLCVVEELESGIKIELHIKTASFEGELRKDLFKKKGRPDF